MPDYKTTTIWKGGHLGEIICGNGAKMSFSAPAALHGHHGVLTPEDAFVGSLNMCFHMMFIWSVERLKIELISYECEAIGFVQELLDRTSTFEKIVLRPRIIAQNCREDAVRRALSLAEKYSLIAQSIKSKVFIEPMIQISS